MAEAPSSTREHSVSDSISKRTKICEEAETGEDRITNLPDNVIVHILSFLPTKYAVGTSILSKRWKYHWTSVPNLEFDDSLLFHPDNPVNRTSFMNFVDRVLDLHLRNVQVIGKLCIFCKQEYDPVRVNAWISVIAARRDIKEVDLRFREVASCFNEWLNSLDDDNYGENPELNSFWHRVNSFEPLVPVISLPSSFFNRENLVYLSLHNMLIHVPESVYFPNLEYLALIGVKWPDDDDSSLENLLLGSPVLTCMNMRTQPWDKTQTYYVCSPMMTSLNINTGRNQGCKVVVVAPNLEVLHLTNHFGEYVLDNLKSLKSAKLHVAQVKERRLFELLGKISIVEELKLSSVTMRSLYLATFTDLPIFHNLSILKVKVVLDVEWKALLLLLECSPNLVTLISKKDGYIEPNEDGYIWNPPPSVPKCLQSCLENIEFKGFEYRNADLEMIEYFLQNAMVLKWMRISSKNLDLETQSIVLRQISMYPRSSKTCRVIFS